MAQLLAEHRLKNGAVLRALLGDLTREEVDAIVNAANEQLAHGGGLAAAIVRAGGPEIQQESRDWVREHGALRHDTAAVTGAGRLPCRHVIHAVGPRWGSGDEDAKLHAAVTAALRAAHELELNRIALPAISTGIFGFPLERAAPIIVSATEAFLETHTGSPLDEVRFTNIDGPTAFAFASEFDRRWPGSADFG